MIPVNEPWLTERDVELATEAVRAGWVSSAGPFVEAFETGWASYCGRKHGIAVTSGTAALQLAVRGLDLGPDDEVILPTFTIVSCALAVVYAGAKPVLVDIDPRTGTIDPAEAAARLTPKTRAIMPVHIYGHPVDMDPIHSLADANGLAVIEDSAEAHGAEYLTGRSEPGARWVRCGNLGTLSIFSFYANKMVTTGEGGMLLTDDDTLADRLRGLRNLCFGAEPARRFHHDDAGFNFRMTNLQAALGVAQLERIGEILSRKRSIAERYEDRLSGQPALILPVEKSWARPVCWVYAIRFEEDSGWTAEAFASALKAKGVESRPFFLGMHQQPMFQQRGLFAGESYPFSERWSLQGLYLPSGLALTGRQIDDVCVAVREILGTA